MNPHKVDAIGLLLLVAVAAGSYFGLFHRGFSEKARLEQEVLDAADHSTERQNLLTELDHAQQVLQPLRESAGGASAVLAKPGNIDQFLGELAASARESEVEIRLLKPGTPTRGEGHNYLPISIVAAGAFPRLHRFLVGLERIDQLTTVEEMAITSEVEATDCEASITLHLHLPTNEKQL